MAKEQNTWNGSKGASLRKKLPGPAKGKKGKQHGAKNNGITGKR